MSLVELEIEARDWSRLRCGCGQSAAHLADDLEQMIHAGDDDVRGARRFEGHAFSPVVLFEPAPALVPVALAALAEPGLPTVRAHFLDLLLSLVAGDGTATEIAAEGRDLERESIDACRTGLWLLYAEVCSSAHTPGAATVAFEILSAIEDDHERLVRVSEAAGDAIDWYAKEPYQDL